MPPAIMFRWCFPFLFFTAYFVFPRINVALLWSLGVDTVFLSSRFIASMGMLSFFFVFVSFLLLLVTFLVVLFLAVIVWGILIRF